MIEDYLARQSAPLCVDCLASAVGLPASQVSMSMQRLTSLGAITTQVGVCARCRRQRTVLKAA